MLLCAPQATHVPDALNLRTAPDVQGKEDLELPEENTDVSFSCRRPVPCRCSAADSASRPAPSSANSEVDLEDMSTTGVRIQTAPSRLEPIRRLSDVSARVSASVIGTEWRPRNPRRGPCARTVISLWQQRAERSECGFQRAKWRRTESCRAVPPSVVLALNGNTCAVLRGTSDN